MVFSDKTGTLTKNEMMLRQTADHMMRLGTGVSKESAFALALCNTIIPRIVEGKTVF